MDLPILFAGAVTLCAQAQETTPKRSMDALWHSFVNRPAESRPMVRWWRFGTALEKPELLREQQQMKSDGIGGAELAFVYSVVVDDSAKGLRNSAFSLPRRCVTCDSRHASSDFGSI